MSCIACMYPQHSSACFVFGIRICSPLPLVPLRRFLQARTISGARSLAPAVCDHKFDTKTRTTIKIRAYLICSSRSGHQWRFRPLNTDQDSHPPMVKWVADAIAEPACERGAASSVSRASEHVKAEAFGAGLAALPTFVAAQLVDKPLGCLCRFGHSVEALFGFDRDRRQAGHS